MSVGAGHSGDSVDGIAETACIQTDARPRPYCTICQVEIVDSPKAIKQHLKSKPHKEALKGGMDDDNRGTGRKKGRKGTSAGAGRSGDSQDEEQEELAGGEDEPCEVCRRLGRLDTRHTLESFKTAVAAGLDVMPCFPPPFQRAPNPLFPGCKTPLVTLQSGRIKEVPDDLEECLDLYCTAGANNGNKVYI